VNWLRAKARYERWKEEHQTVRDEMGNTIRFYEFKRDQWAGRAERSRGSRNMGHVCFAMRQVDMWGEMAKRARCKFGNDAI
jgi:hypothetical protein